jgi:hypothetical protein
VIYVRATEKMRVIAVIPTENNERLRRPADPYRARGRADPGVSADVPTSAIQDRSKPLEWVGPLRRSA